MTAGVIGGALGQWPLGYLSDKFGRRGVLILAAVGGGAVGLAIAAAGDHLNFFTLNLLGVAWGAMAFPLDFAALPQTGAGAIEAGSTKLFQAWFRDTAAGGAGSNLSGGMRVTFAP